MRPSSSLLGASRLPLTTKRANKDFYKGTGQSYAPGGGHRTGPPGKHIIRGKGKYRLLDERVRYFVSPGQETLEGASSRGLKPYISTLIPHTPSPAGIPPFSPVLPKNGLTVPSLTPGSPSSSSGSRSGSGPGERTLRTSTEYSRWYWARTADERSWDIIQARRNWWGGMSRYLSQARGEGEKTEEVEARSATATATGSGAGAAGEKTETR